MTNPSIYQVSLERDGEKHPAFNFMKAKNQPIKTYIKNLFLLPTLLAALSLMSPGRVTAQTFTTLHSFTEASDGATPYAGLMLSGNTLYGTASGGGSSGAGTVFAVNTDGTGFTTLHHFTGGRGGGLPYAGLLLSGNTLYGTTSDLYNGYGTVFSLSFRPQLTITTSGAYVILSWPTNVAGFDYTGYTLQSTANLVSPEVWNINSPEPVVVNGQNTVTTPISGAPQFYRLSQ